MCPTMITATISPRHHLMLLVYLFIIHSPTSSNTLDLVVYLFIIHSPNVSNHDTQSSFPDSMFFYHSQLHLQQHVEPDPCSMV